MADELEFFEPEDVPQAKEEVRFRRLTAKPYSDGRRVRLEVSLTPFVERPNVEFEIVNADGQSVGTLTVIESMDHEFEVTMHVRGPAPLGSHSLRARLFYLDGPPGVTAETTFELPKPTHGGPP